MFCFKGKNVTQFTSLSFTPLEKMTRAEMHEELHSLKAEIKRLEKRAEKFEDQSFHYKMKDDYSYSSRSRHNSGMAAGYSGRAQACRQHESECRVRRDLLKLKLWPAKN